MTYTQQKYYVFNASRTGPGLTLQDSLTLPYAATITFNGLFATLASLSDFVETKLQQIIEYLMVSKIQMAQAELSKEHPSCSPCGTTPSNHSRECIAMSDVCAKFDRIAAALVAMTDTIPVRQTAFKYLTCKYCVSPDPFLRTTPFYQTDPVTAYFGTANDSLLYGVEQVIFLTSPSFLSFPFLSFLFFGFLTHFSFLIFPPFPSPILLRSHCIAHIAHILFLFLFLFFFIFAKTSALASCRRSPQQNRADRLR